VFVPYGGDVPGDPPGPRRLAGLGLDPGGYVLIVARLVPENNVLPMLEAATRTGAPVVVVGSGGGNEVEARVRARHAPPRVRALGHVFDQELLSTLWAHCGVYLHGHSVGGTNPALVQALGLGAPVLAYDTPFNREVLVREELLVPLDPEVIAERARGLLASAPKRSDAADWGFKRVDEVYNWEAVCDGYETALRKTARSSD
jgi:glycosyltransferase involved in cell wall biosynthesis